MRVLELPAGKSPREWGRIHGESFRGEVRALAEIRAYLCTKVGGFKSGEQGAATTIWCATSPALADLGGVYCEDCDVAVAVAADATGVHGVRPWATDPAAAERLWGLSESWVARAQK